MGAFPPPHLPAVLCRRQGNGCVEATGAIRIFDGMETSRLEIRMPVSQWAELSALATDLGLSSADLARLAIRRLINHSEELLGGGSAAAPSQAREGLPQSKPWPHRSASS